MKKLYFLFSLVLILIVVSAGIESSNGKEGKTKSPGETSCVSCHSGNAENSGGGSITFTSDIPTTGYIPGTTYQCSVTVAKTGITSFGFGVEALRASDYKNSGTLIITDATKTRLDTATANDRVNVVHTTAGKAGQDQNIYTFSWQAPSVDSGRVVFYFAGIAGNGTGTSGDFVYYDSSEALSVGIVEKAIAEQNFSVYPNPAKDDIKLNFTAEKNSEITISLNDLQGRRIHSFSSGRTEAGNHTEKFTLPADLSKGIYFIMIEIDGKKQVQKLSVL